MFNFFKKKPTGKVITLKLSGLHCSSCSLNIDGEIEEISGVVSSNTSYAKQETVIVYNPALTDTAKFVQTIQDLGYKVLS